MISGKVTEDSIYLLCKHPVDTQGMLHSKLQSYLCSMRNLTVISLLTFQPPLQSSLDELFEAAETHDNPETITHLLHALFTATVKPTFHKINVHAALTPTEIKALFEPAFLQADKIHNVQRAEEQQADKIHNAEEQQIAQSFFRLPFVTVRF